MNIDLQTQKGMVVIKEESYPEFNTLMTGLIVEYKQQKLDKLGETAERIRKENEYIFNKLSNEEVAISSLNIYIFFSITFVLGLSLLISSIEKLDKIPILLGSVVMILSIVGILYEDK